ncbi:LysR family transcriptional regulator [Gordonibacter sp.]|uniref:LysR family transcriptional regulator n=1 Tax=Gordonibacter sp. TaxID=1968902 RepID=UPI002FC7BDCA
MDTRYVKEFLTFAEEMNYSAAAKKLYITRPTLTDHLRELEEELGCELVGKCQGKAVLTPAGRHFIQTGSRLLDTVQAIADEYRGFADNVLTVTVAQTNLPWIETILYRARHAIQERYPEKCIDIETVTGPFSTSEALLDGTNDIVIAGYKSYVPQEERVELALGVQGFKLCTEEIKLLMTQDNPLFNKPSIAACDLDGAVFMLPPDIYRGYLRDGVDERFLEQGSRITLRTMDFSDHFEYFVYDFQDMLGIVPTTLISRFGIDERKECRAFSLADMKLNTDFYALFSNAFVASENGALLACEMKRLAEASLAEML